MDNPNIKVSVIIPFRNSEKFIKSCLDSVVSQDIDGCEILAVDYGSTDGSLKLLSGYNTEKIPVKLLRNEEIAVSDKCDALNEGIKVASGKYVSFIDPDGFYPSRNVLSRLCNYAESGNLNVVGGYHCISDGDKSSPVLSDPVFGILNRKKNDLVAVYEGVQQVSVCQAYIFNLQYLKDNKLQFVKPVTDTFSLFLVSSLFEAKRFGLINECTYVKPSENCSDVPEDELYDLMESCGVLLKYSAEARLSVLHRRIINTIQKYKPSIIKSLRNDLSLRLCATLCHAMSFVDHKAVAEHNGEAYYYPSVMDAVAECIAGIISNSTELMEKGNGVISEFLNSLWDECNKLVSESAHADIFIIRIMYYLWRPSVPRYVRMAVYELIRNNAFNCRAYRDDLRLGSCVAALESVIPSVEFNERFQKRNDELKVEVIHAPTSENDNIILSVIVPVYNVEKYLSDCLDSILSDNSVDNMEVICVDDGSSDKSLDILRDYAGRFGSVTVLSQENAGPSAARNTGMKYARGRYIHFLDSDDAMVPNSYNHLLEVLQKNDLDVLLFNAESFYEDDILESRYPAYKEMYRRNRDEGKITSGAEYYTVRHFKSNIIVQPCMYISKRSFVEDMHLRFQNGIMHEDNIFTTKLLFGAQRVMHINNEYYRRRVRNGSLTVSNVRFEHAFGYYATYKELLRFTGTLNLSPLYMDCLLERCYRYRQSAVSRYNVIDNESEKYFYLGLDSSLALDFFHEVVSPALSDVKIRNGISSIKALNEKIAERDGTVRHLKEELDSLKKEYESKLAGTQNTP